MSNQAKRILIVEDDFDIRETLEELLAEVGYQVSSATNGQAALTLLKADPHFDLILLDLMMPVMDGLEFRARQMADTELSKIPIVIMSADGNTHQKMKEASVTSYITKPVDMVPLLSLIERTLTLQSM